MGINTKKTCDKCGDSWIDNEGDKRLTRLQLKFTPFEERITNYNENEKILYLCKSCFLATGLKYQHKDKNNPTPENLTAEESIAVFLEELGFRREE